ncbi:MAG: argininosuccinate lyase, partial [Erysipelotrichia bacterium]|nr:argininosuccinate lyase [Erysipelotrichia bacterium]
MELWGARFNKEVDQRLNDFNSSIAVDKHMYAQDIKGSIAHVKMLAKQNIIAKEDQEIIIQTLQAIQNDIETNTLIIDPSAEDIHMFIEKELTKRCGDAGKRLHTARSRNDQVALDFRMYSMDACNEIKTLLISFIEVLCKKAKAHTTTIMPGYTHLQRAQPITFAHHLMAYVEMFLRDISRLDDAIKRCNVLVLGSGALATTTYPIDREYVKELLAFDRVSMNSLDGVSDRDFAIEMANALSIIMMHLSRLSEEIVLWSSWEFKFIELDDAFATGSS